MSRRWLLKATMERVAWRHSPRSPEKLVSVCLSDFVLIAAGLRSITELCLGLHSAIRTPAGVLPGLKWRHLWMTLLLTSLPRDSSGSKLRKAPKRVKKFMSVALFGKGEFLDELGAKSKQQLNYRRCD